MINNMTLSGVHGVKRTSIITAFVISLAFAFFSQDFPLFLVGQVLFIFFFFFLFNKNLPPVLLFSFFFQWLFFQAQLFDALWKGVSLIDLDYISKTKPEVVLLGFIGTFSFFFGIYVFARRVPVISFEDFRNFFLSIRLERLLRIYLVIYFILFSVGNFIWFFPGLSQPLYAFTLFRWGLFFLLFTTVFFHNRLKGALFILILVDIAIGFFSFFSNFKEVIYFSFLAYWIFFFRSTRLSKFSMVIVVILTIYLGAFWTAIKEDYRSFLNMGSGAQTIRVSQNQAYSKLFQLAGGIQGNDLDRGFDELIDRLSYIIVFDEVYKRVPQKIPHEQGALWWAGISRPFLPRLLFPGKKTLEDSKELNYYSALNVEEKNTSISLSMMAGSYVDFGKWGMHIPLFLFGIFCGWVYLKAVKWGRYPVVGYALTMPMIFLLHINEESINRIVSSMVLYLLVLWFIQKFLLGTFLRNILVMNPSIKNLKS